MLDLKKIPKNIIILNNIINFMNKKNKTQLTQTLHVIKSLRNMSAHMDHFIARSSQYYPTNRSVRYNTNNVIDSAWFQKNCFAKMYQILYDSLKTIVKNPVLKIEVNTHLTVIRDIVKKSDYIHLGFDQSKVNNTSYFQI